MIRGFVAGVLGLTALQAIVGTDAAANRAGGLMGGLAAAVESALSPFTPAIKDRSDVGLAGVVSPGTPFLPGQAPTPPAWLNSPTAAKYGAGG